MVRHLLRSLLYVGLAVTFVFGVFASAPAYACSPTIVASPTLLTAQQITEQEKRVFASSFDKADAVFQGRVISVAFVRDSFRADAFRKHIRIAVNSVWKGTIATEVTVVPVVLFEETGGSAYGECYPPREQQIDTVTVGEIVVTYTQRTKPHEHETFRFLKSFINDMNYLGVGMPPDASLIIAPTVAPYQTPAPIVPRAVGNSGNTLLVLPVILAFVVALVIVGLAVLGRRLRPY